jgi:hypothetical protein
VLLLKRETIATMAIIAAVLAGAIAAHFASERHVACADNERVWADLERCP